MTTNGQDIFDLIGIYFNCNNLPWDSCINMCIDGALSMSTCVKGFVRIVQKKLKSYFYMLFSTPRSARIKIISA